MQWNGAKSFFRFHCRVRDGFTFLIQKEKSKLTSRVSQVKVREEKNRVNLEC